jgi:hypothetical protein
MIKSKDLKTKISHTHSLILSHCLSFSHCRSCLLLLAGAASLTAARACFFCLVLLLSLPLVLASRASDASGQVWNNFTFAARGYDFNGGVVIGAQSQMLTYNRLASPPPITALHSLPPSLLPPSLLPSSRAASI